MQRPTKHSTTLALCAIFVVSCKAQNNSDNEVKVVGGTVAQESDSRFRAVNRLDVHGGICTGTFVTPTKMLTAAHCIQNRSQSGISLISPTVVQMPPSVKDQGVVGVAEAQKGFGRPAAYKDVVILSFATTNNTHTLPICNTQATIGEAVYLVGYGFDENHTIGVKRFAEMKVTGLSPDLSIITVEGTKSNAQGDSGGPLISISRSCILGVTSYIEKSSGTYFTSHYVDLSTPLVRAFLDSEGLIPKTSP